MSRPGVSHTMDEDLKKRFEEHCLLNDLDKNNEWDKAVELYMIEHGDPKKTLEYVVKKIAVYEGYKKMLEEKTKTGNDMVREIIEHFAKRFHVLFEEHGSAPNVKNIDYNINEVVKKYRVDRSEVLSLLKNWVIEMRTRPEYHGLNEKFELMLRNIDECSNMSLMLSKIGAKTRIVQT